MFYATTVNNIEDISGMKFIELDTFEDARGEIWPLYSNKNDFLPSFEEDKLSISHKNVLRGLHGDSEIGKLITCISGQFQLAIADLRKDSPTYYNSRTLILSDERAVSIYVPPGCVNGHLCLSKKCIFHYKWSKSYKGAENQVTIKWNDPTLDIDWIEKNPILSERDQNGTDSRNIFL
jgi:dTDP-4-dehydrorhamnose 3,5-epimerase